MATSTGYHVIVGGLGSLGKTLQKTLLDQGKKVRVVDICRHKAQASPRLVEDSSIDYHSCHLPEVDDTNLKLALKDAETVYGMVTGDVMKGTAADVYRANEHGTQQLLDACQQVGVPKYIHASTMGVTNQMINHDHEDETVELPPWETYQIPYDISKRRGEELVLAANLSSSNFQTVALRLGAILASPTDYVSRSMMERPGTVTSFESPRWDFVSARDICRAMVLASDKMDLSQSDIAGRALFLTKSKDNRGFDNGEVAKMYADQLGWKYTALPPFVMKSLITAAYTKAYLKDLIVTPTDENTIAYPTHLAMHVMYNNTCTFDNSLVRNLLNFEPEDTLEDVIGRICTEIRLENPELFPAANAV